MTLVTAGSMVANIAGYVLHVPASRWLGPAGYSEFAALLTAQLVLAVPALALQTVVARELVRGASPGELRALQQRCAALVAALALVAVVPLAAILDIGVLPTVAALIVAPVLVLLSGEQGLLQGAGRFRELAIVLGAAGVFRVAPAVVVLAVGGGTAAALVASACGIAVTTAGARAVAGRSERAGRPSAGVAAVLKASQVQLAVIALSSLDLLIARIVLSEDNAGLYALGAVATKAAFWLPQAVGVVLYPRMAHPEHSARALRTALAVLAVLGAVTVLGVLVASPLAPLVVGDKYSPVQGLLWAFALHGACLAIVQCALLSAIAGDRTRVALIAWAGLVIEVSLMFALGHSVAQLIGIAVACASATAIVACAVALENSRSIVVS
ncbi:polysaccharide biosynthesis protein [Antrihabitans sp. YC2-6]|nr:polysaccharide biosynthesis protein [Antrihabitans sp. YC2-6]MBJ8347718.1 polysaccharide biosynthesis protein [Antrihabitans sp. YC2-6]